MTDPQPPATPDPAKPDESPSPSQKTDTASVPAPPLADAIAAAAEADEPVYEYWLENPKSVRLLTRIGIALLAAVAVGELFVEHHQHFPYYGIDIDVKPEFFVVFGFVSCLLMVLFAKALQPWLKRPVDYYDADGPTGPTGPDQKAAKDGQSGKGADA